ncbi:GDP-mannose 4,6-dehydratase [Paenibacillus sp. NPDC101420]|uniref:GDP-mannose 4,6-dehydratase n=1 Tax=Paenibacillus sp. NPDC101420 TaxID=3390602 RepID=UPI003D055D20
MIWRELNPDLMLIDMRVLVTGSTGFVGEYMMDFLENKNIDAIGSSRDQVGNSDVITLDIVDVDQINKVIKGHKPTHIVHLAGQSNVKFAWEDPQTTILNNTIGTVNILNAIRDYSPYTTFLSIGSSEEYGNSSEVLEYVDESYLTSPKNPYGVSKLSACYLVQQYVQAYQVQALHVRPFNHIGPKQSEGFVTQDFAKQIVDIEKGRISSHIRVGNLSSVRDFTDVRDIVAAYYELLLKGKTGEIYNVCSGKGFSIQEILDEFISLSDSSIKVEIDPTRFRPIENKYLVGSNKKIKEDTNWSPEIDVKTSLNEILNYYRNL